MLMRRRVREIERAVNRPRRHKDRVANRELARANDRPVTLLGDHQLPVEHVKPLGERMAMRRWTTARLCERVDDVERCVGVVAVQQQGDVVATGDCVYGSLGAVQGCKRFGCCRGHWISLVAGSKAGLVLTVSRKAARVVRGMSRASRRFGSPAARTRGARSGRWHPHAR